MAETSSKSSQLSMMPAARAMATKCMVWLVEPPVAIRPMIALTNDFSDSISPMGLMLRFLMPSERRAAAARVRASRIGVCGLKKAAAGRCTPIISIII